MGKLDVLKGIVKKVAGKAKQVGEDAKEVVKIPYYNRNAAKSNALARNFVEAKKEYQDNPSFRDLRDDDNEIDKPIQARRKLMKWAKEKEKTGYSESDFVSRLRKKRIDAGK